MKMPEILNLDVNTFSIFMATKEGVYNGEPFYNISKVFNNLNRGILEHHPFPKKT
jgi:hypothetical protein